VYHPDWIANPILVRKKNNEWRMCVDYTDLNKHCPKDPFGLHHIDEVVDSTAGCELLSFLDCYSGYPQISLKEDDQIKTSFITPFGVYCYTTMSFRLKNTRATYQRAIQQCLHNEIRDDLVEAYVDDVVIKTRDTSTLIDNIDRTFKALNKYKWKLNPKKCIFGVPSSTARQRRQSRRHTAKPLKSQGSARYATTQERQRRSKAHGVHGSSQPVYL